MSDDDVARIVMLVAGVVAVVASLYVATVERRARWLVLAVVAVALCTLGLWLPGELVEHLERERPR